MVLDFNSGIDLVDQDIRYMDQLYASSPSRFDNWRDWCKNNLISSISDYAIPAGKIIMAGTWNGDLYSMFQTKYGSENCVGFDIVNYYDDPHNTIVYGDFRIIHENNNHDTSIFYNELGTWEHNATYKQSGLTYALRNLVPGGIYLEPYTKKAEYILSNTTELEVLKIDRLIICRLL
jgi:hypothetical protein